MSVQPVPLFEDEYLLAFDKPSGLLCVPGRGPDKQDCLSRCVQDHWPEALIIHRLDMGTSGIVLMARSLEMQRAMSAAFAERRVHKTYEAVVAGHPDVALGEWQEIDAPILLDWPNRPIHIVDAAGKPSLTRWKVREWLNAPLTFPSGNLTTVDDAHREPVQSAARLTLQPVTGRTHQLRVHLRHIGHPMLGDGLYAPPSALNASNRLLLHAHTLRFFHPMSATEVEIQSPVPF